MAYDPLEMQRQKMSGYPNSETIGQGNQQILAQNAAKAAAFAQAANQPAPVTQPNPEVAEFVQAKANNQANNSPRVAGQAGTVYNIFSRPAAEQKQVQQTVQTPAVTTPVNSWNTTPQNQPIRSMDDLANAMGYTSPEQEEKLRKASVANQRIVAVADALRQIGNIYNTTRYAPSQQFNSPVELERQRYLQGKALRDRANQTYISYQQAKAAQDAKQRQWEAEQKQKADQWNATFKYNAAKAAADLAEKQRQYDSTLGFNKEKQKATEARWKAQDEETRRHHNATIGLGYARLNETKRHNGVVESRGGGSGSRSQNTIYSRRGYLTKAGASEADMKRIYDNMYEWGKTMKYRGKDGKLHPYIDEGGILEGIAPDVYGGKKISDVSKREAVDKMIMEHDDAAVQLHGKHGFEWHEQKPNDKRNSYSQYIVQPNGSSNGGTDYSQYIRK